MKIIYEKDDKVRDKQTGEVRKVIEFLPERGLIRCEGMTYKLDDVTPVIVDHSAKATELAKLAELHGLEGCEFEDDINNSLQDKVLAEARALKNRGMAAQIEFLLGSMGTHPERQKNALEMVENIIKDNAIKGMVNCLACRQSSFKEQCENYLDGWRCPKCVAEGREQKK